MKEIESRVLELNKLHDINKNYQTFTLVVNSNNS